MLLHRFYISFGLVNTIGRFRVGFGEGHVFNTIEHSFLATVPKYLSSEPPQYVPEAT